MGPKLLESRLCLLLLLGLVLMLASCLGQTPSQWFAIQHIYKKVSPKCDDAMRVVNRYTGKCKDLNTFLHTTFADAVRVCHNPRKTCKDGTSPNCHDSSSKVSVTICKLTKWARNYSQCRYKTTGAEKSYTVACNPRTPRDSPTYPVVPVHLDGTF
uniref:Eosinophil-associated ribonuclease 33 n=1 Tax=Mus caroli TaxID=10089 RepID=Q9JKG2_MUSCR|nr:eosinophil-associated ribonuclease 33 precursor [Mus caroli]